MCLRHRACTVLAFLFSRSVACYCIPSSSSSECVPACSGEVAECIVLRWLHALSHSPPLLLCCSLQLSLRCFSLLTRLPPRSSLGESHTHPLPLASSSPLPSIPALMHEMTTPSSGVGGDVSDPAEWRRQAELVEGSLETMRNEISDAQFKGLGNRQKRVMGKKSENNSERDRRSRPARAIARLRAR